MKRIIYIATLFLVLGSCNKDKFQTKPQLRLISVNTRQVPIEGTMRVVLEYTDKEGDIADSFFMTKQRLNLRTVDVTVRDTINDFAVPEFPNTSEGQFELTLPYQGYLVSALKPPRIPGSDPSENEPDTLAIKFLVRDKEGNKSDSLILSPVVIIR